MSKGILTDDTKSAVDIGNEVEYAEPRVKLNASGAVATGTSGAGSGGPKSDTD